MGDVPSPATTSIAPARRCAYTVLRRVFEQGAYAEKALHAASKELDPRDRALAMRLGFGAIQRKGTLDHLIENLAGRAVTRLDAPVLAALRLGLYELLYLDGSPDYAVVGDAVELAKRGGGAGHGLVNAVLRRAAREQPGALLGGFGDATPEQAAIKHSHPEWIARLYWQELGADGARALMAQNNEPGEVALRANTLLVDRATLAAELAVRTRTDEDLPEALVLEEPFDMHASAQWKAGRFLAQSRAAMLVARVLGPEGGERALDLCAAPGGKSTHLAALMGGEGEVLAVERNSRRAGTLARTAQRLHAPNIRVEVADAASERADPGSFDRVLVDPPCSGLGTLQARPDLRWRATPAASEEMSALQARILAAGAHALRPGGVLVYSTCTISPNENERVIAAFLDSHTDFALDDLASEPLQLGRPIQAPGEGTPAGTPASDVRMRSLMTLPHRDHTAGFFIARMRRS
jgi:16S rRNA (cytosine967-C5)-methyltransferase